MGVKLGLLCWRTNTGWRYLRMGWWGRYFELTRRNWQEDGKICLIIIFMIYAPDQVFFVFIKWGMKREGKRLAHTRRRETHTALCLGNLKERDHFEDLGADGIIIIIMSIFQKYCRRVLPWLIWLWVGQLIGCFEHGDEYSGSMNCRVYIDWLRTYTV